MTHQEKLQAMYQHMERLGIAKGTVAPPVWRLLWRLGVEVPPPLFASFMSNALVMGTFFGVLWALAMWVMFWARQGMPLGVAAMAAIAAGVLFGLSMAFYFRYLARKHGLVPWARYTGASQRA